ncbi:growth/differentiation factor 8-like isoform X2 [Melanaphis sacchari]|uniref:growth/differentiation factor 8-like isoform X2 n=1 Tax=Melanaphis sacchari TaxID=742174 RepID=UPI000DC150B9|nr:growth/differentiation factor 8-like isoform X2 [Melanaphis sacchari]
MRRKMPNVAVVAVAVAALLLVTAETVLTAGGGGGGGGGGGRQRGAATAAADRQQDIDSGDDESLRTPAAVQCANCLGHEGIKSLSIELIKASILNKLGMQRPPEFGGRLPPRVPTDLPPLQDLMRRYNNDHGSSVVVFPRIRHKSHHFDDSVTDMQSDEATGYSTTAAAAASAENANSYNVGNMDVDDDDYHVKTHKLIAFAQPHPTVQKLRGHYPLYFTFSEQTGQQRITEAILWLYKRRLDVVIDDAVVMIEVYRIYPITLHQSFVSSLKCVINTTQPGWVPIDLQRHMSDWFKTTDGPKNLTLAVHAYYVNKNTTHARTPYVTDARKREDMTEIPYLEVHTREDRRSRVRRNAASGLTCNETSTETRCCRFPLTVDFEEFGWHWIIAPKRYVANYCSGACDPMLFPKYPHTHLVQMTKFGTGPCCAPRKMSAISMLYYDPDFNIIYGMLPGMVVDRCGCS